MLTQHTLTTLKALKLDGMAHAFEDQLTQPACQTLSFEERLAMLVDREVNHRDNKRLARLLHGAKLKIASACLEDIDGRPGRGLDSALLASLATCDWLRHGQHVVLTGATGVGKTWLACALGQQACRQGFSVLYARVPRLFEELKIAHGDGSFTRKLYALAKIDLLLLDDFGLAALGTTERTDLLELLDDRIPGRSVLITSQLPVDAWYEYLNDPTLADAILDRVLHRAHRLVLTGESLRKRAN
jgi:DNA replication protein DnaC